MTSSLGSVTVDTALPVDVRRTLFGMRFGGPGDPCFRSRPDGVWWATRFPSGAATVRVVATGRCTVLVQAAGPGSSDALAQAPALVGASDDDGGLPAVSNPVVRDLAHRYPDIRMGATGQVFEAVMGTILHQKIQGTVATANFRSMVQAHRAPAPVIDGGPRLLLPPDPEWILDQPSWAWHRWGVEKKRALTIRTVASYAHRLDTADLCSLPGVGPWTAANVAAIARGDPDAVPVGDYWIKHHVCHTLAGHARGSDEEMLELLAPFPGQRGRVVRLVMAGGPRLPRFGPRLPLQPIAGI